MARIADNDCRAGVVTLSLTTAKGHIRATHVTAATGEIMIGRLWHNSAFVVGEVWGGGKVEVE